MALPSSRSPPPLERAFAQTTPEEEEIVCTGRPSDPLQCREVTKYGNERTVLYITQSEQSRIDSLERQIDSRIEQFDRQYPDNYLLYGPSWLDPSNPTQVVSLQQALDFGDYDYRQNPELFIVKRDYGASTEPWAFMPNPAFVDLLTTPEESSHILRSDAPAYYVSPAAPTQVVNSRFRLPTQSAQGAHNRAIQNLIDQINRIQEQASARFTRQAAVCATTINSLGEDQSRAYTCTPFRYDTDGNAVPIEDDVTLTRVDFEDPRHFNPTDADGIIIQEYRLTPLRPDPGEAEVRPEPPVPAGHWLYEETCRFAVKGECREVTRNGRTYWVEASPRRVSGNRVYPDTGTESDCVRIHGQCERVTTHVEDGTPQTRVNVPTGFPEYLGQAACERVHRSCELVEVVSNGKPGTNNRWVPTISGRVYVDGVDTGTTGDANTECVRNQDPADYDDGVMVEEDSGKYYGCVEYKRDSDGDGTPDQTVYIPMIQPTSVAVTVVTTTTTTDPVTNHVTVTSRETERVTVPGTDRTAPDTREPEPEPEPDAVPINAVRDANGNPVTWTSGSECLRDARTLYCMANDDGIWYGKAR